MNTRFITGLAQREAAALEAQRSNQPLVIWPEDKLLADLSTPGAQAVLDTLPGLLTPGDAPGWTMVGFLSLEAGLAEFASFLETEYAYATSIARTRVYKYERKK